MARSRRSSKTTRGAAVTTDRSGAGPRWLDYWVVLVLGGGIFVLLTTPARGDRFEDEPGTTPEPAVATPEPAGTTPAMALGTAEARVEDAALEDATNGVYRFRSRHPWIYGAGAFVLGSLLAAIFVAIPYLKTTYESADLTVAFHRLVIGGLGGGVAAVILAFAYTGAVRRTYRSRNAGGISGSSGSAIVPPHPAQ